MKLKLEEGLTFDDLLLLPNYSDVLPSSVLTKSQFSQNISLNIPVVSSAMDTVTECNMAVMMASLGGLGIIHKNLSPERQVEEVIKVKESKVDKKRFPMANLDKKNHLICGAAMGVSVFSCWFWNFVVSSTFLTLLNSAGPGNTF